MEWSAVSVRDSLEQRDPTCTTHGKPTAISLRPTVRRSLHVSATAQPQQSIPSIHSVSIAPIRGSSLNSSKLKDQRSNSRDKTEEEEILRSRRTHSAGIRDKASRDHPTCPPGDRIIFTDSPTLTGVPLVYRLPEDRQTNPDRLNLDRRRLSVCPLLEGEDQLRLLNLQHNMITKIQHLSSLRRLIFLDLYDNMIMEISGLQTLVSLRVLMLGKNRITSIGNLERLTKLDVLDLHGNLIHEIENLNHLTELRVLNLAGNQIACVHNLVGLTSLTELNLRRNVITEVYDIDGLPSLQRLFLSYNQIISYEDIKCLSSASSLIELSLDCNPYANNPTYKQTLLDQIQLLKLLDMKKVSDEEHRSATIFKRKEVEKKREYDKRSVEKERRELAISNAEQQWLALRNRSRLSRSQPQSADAAELKRRQSSRSSSLSTERTTPVSNSVSRERSFSVTRNSSRAETVSMAPYFCDLDGEVLSLYGVDSLGELDKNWGVQTTAAVITITFHFMYFDTVADNLYKVKAKFPGVMNLVFQHNDVWKLQQLNALSCLRRLDSLTVHSDGNPVTNLSLWKPYTLFRLAHLGLRKLNDEEVTPSDIVSAEKLFGNLSHITTSELPQSRLLSLLGDARRKQVLQAAVPPHQDDSDIGDTQRHHLISAALMKSQGQSVEAVGKSGLQYWLLESSQKKSQAFQSCIEAAEKFVASASDEAIRVYKLQQQLERIWPDIIKNTVRTAAEQMVDKDKYMRLSLEKLQ
ncbi:leucine-rich repeat-containing protein 49-like isoform X1 [Corticium candelabrum]|uniref:leucine-rich repeat-containing protein 49-like isoform X1 n=1 Tax=Corticium candelabrum TaxID=121492 RepID=UPI002E27615A|nr:leucine-rich repeat-containing protein 49-like isoform X1 [Corticium candelabrum]